MHRLLRPTGVALGFFAVLLSCVPDRQLAVEPLTLTRLDDRAAVMAPVRISEIHYDNAGTDAGEAIEISGPAGADIEGWTIVLYNGNGGGSYEPTRTLHGTIPALPPATSGCVARGVVFESYAVNGIQNGDPDGVALIDADGNVVEFFSYEGTFVASNGAARGLRSKDIGVREAGSEPVGRSIKRTGADTWIGPSAAHTFGKCNDEPGPQNAIASITVEPATATMFAGALAPYTATAFDAGSVQLPGATVTWTSSELTVATVSSGGIVTALAPGSTVITATAANGVSGSASLDVEEVTPLPPTSIFISEIHYDDDGVDEGEAIEIEAPAGTNLANWSIVLYNGSNGATYNTRVLTGTIPALCAGRGVLSFSYPENGIQNGSPDAIALLNAAGVVVEFISYEGSLRATNGPALGRLSTDIGVAENGSQVGRSVQKDAIGWYGPNPTSFGACNIALDPFTSITGRFTPLPVGFEDQLFGTLNDGRGGTLPPPSAFMWSSDTPEIASIDADGIMHALAAGTAVIRATAPTGETGTLSLATFVAAASTTASYVGNTEFGVPTDADASDDFIVTRAQYTSSFNRLKGIPNWVSFNLEATHFGDEDRCDCFTFDPALPAAFTRYTTADYTGAGAVAGYGIDRGHLARSFDRTSASLDNATTFYFTNIIPQASDNNQGPWAEMENDLGDLARLENKELYIIAGASGSKGTVKNEGKITIPASVWKVVLIMPRDQGLANVRSLSDLEVIAVIMPNDPGIRGADWHDYETTINAVEALSGYNVLSLLDKRVEAVVEAGMQDEMALVDQLVAAGKISTGNGNSLTSKLEAAAASLDRGNTTAAVNQLEAFLHEVDAMDSKRLSAADANALRTAIGSLIASISS